ncbi:hypothetical protein, partial [Xanthovirga aplysinae]|uniref:hypothetical protein n=1 Tax=Xanthovirga aplysinae TaxID=2529853 RepID=UPI001CA412CC
MTDGIKGLSWNTIKKARLKLKEVGLIDFKEGNSGKATIENSIVYQLIVSASNPGSNFDSCTG